LSLPSLSGYVGDRCREPLLPWVLARRARSDRYHRANDEYHAALFQMVGAALGALSAAGVVIARKRKR